MRAKDYRAQAWAALKGKWLRTAVLVLLAVMLGGASTGGVSISLPDTDALMYSGASQQDVAALMITAVIIILAGLAWALFLGSFVRVGMANMLNRVLDGEKPHADMLFPKKVYWSCVKMSFLRGLYIFLWSLLVVIPAIIAIAMDDMYIVLWGGWLAAIPSIIATYRYAMADYLICSKPGIGAREAIRESCEHMKGRKWRLFCLELSFIGWTLLSIAPIWVIVIIGALMAVFAGESVGMIVVIVLLALLTLLVVFAGSILLQTYVNTARIAFFRDIQRGVQWHREADEGEAYARENWAENEAPVILRSGEGEAEAEEGQCMDGAHLPVQDESAAKEIFLGHKCSHARMKEDGSEADYLKMDPFSLSEERWKRDYADGLMRRFDREPGALDDILDLTAEYALEDLFSRMLERIDRHIRQESLPAAEVLDMTGRALALLVSETFSGNDGFVRRKKDQICDMANRLEVRLEQMQTEGEWKSSVELIRSMCR